MKVNIICKHCGNISNNGTNFCSRSCRLAWRKIHNYTKKDWKRIHRRNENLEIKMSGGTDQGDMGDHRREV